MNNGILLREPFEAYQAQSALYLTSHQLADFRRCPLLYRKKALGLIPDEDRPAYLVGRALHTLILEGEAAFQRGYAIGGPINPKTGEVYGANTKAFADWTAAQGKPVLTRQQYELIQRMTEAVRQHALANELLAEGEAEGVARAEYCKMPCQARLDWFSLRWGIVDLKTCDDLDYFEADARRYGYVHQVAFYRAVLARLLEGPRPVYFIAAEKKEPYRVGLWKVEEEILGQACEHNEIAIERLRRCMASDIWPTGYEECRVFDRL